MMKMRERMMEKRARIMEGSASVKNRERIMEDNVLPM